MLKVDAYSAKGTKLTQVSLPKEMEAKGNLALLAQVKHVYEERSHIGMAKTKTRAEVNRTKKKLYRQKGTGGARHGAKSAPIFVGGGVAHGPQPLRRLLSLSSGMRKKALAVAITAKAKAAEIVVVSGISAIKKTKDANSLLAKLGKKDAKKGRFIFILAEKNLPVGKFFRNLTNVEVIGFKNLSVFKVILGGVLVFDNEIFEVKKTKEAK